MDKILIVDDDVAVTNYLMVFLMQTEEFESTVVNDSPAVPDMLEGETFDVILLDMDMPGLTGLDILREMREKGLETPVVILSGVNDVDLAVNALKLGAFDYLTKPVEDEKLLDVLRSAVKQKSLKLKINEMPTILKREDLTFKEAFEHVPTQDAVMIRMFHLAEKMAAGGLSIYIVGEHGTGKESLARAIHKASPRRDKRFVAIDVVAWEPEAFSSQLFGQAKDWSGAKEEKPGFLEEADGGTLFMNNIGVLTLPVQVRLLQVIQHNEFYRDGSTKINEIDVRIIASSDLDLASDEYKYKFSRDLIYHLMINSLHIQPLRERVEDIPLIAEHFLKIEMEKTGKEISGFSTEFIELLKGYDFPRNTAEISAIIASAVVNCDCDIITPDSLSPYTLEMLKSGNGNGG